MTTKTQETKTPAARKNAKTKRAATNKVAEVTPLSARTADNAESGADGLRFNENDYFNFGALPCIENGGAAISDLADVFAASGLFGELTPAQITVQILAGRELGFDPVAAMYNLELSPGFKIDFRGDPSAPLFVALQDVISIKKTTEPPEQAKTFCPVCGGANTYFAVVKNEKEMPFLVCSEKCQKQAQINPAIKHELTPEQKETLLRDVLNNDLICPVCGVTDTELNSIAYKVKADSEKGIVKVCSAACSSEYRRQRDANDANASDLSASNSEKDITPPQPGELSTGADGGGKANAKTGEPKPKTPDEQVKDKIKQFCFQLNSIGKQIDATEKTVKYDSLETETEKKKYFETVRNYYAAQRTEFETEITGVFISQTWTPAEQSKYIYAATGNKNALPDCTLVELSAVLSEMKKDRLV